jgi:uncharacterized membrane protein
MKSHRISSLTDAVFAIIMTLLVIDIKVPEISHTATPSELSSAVFEAFPLMASFSISFTLLATYWMAHNYILYNYVAKTDRVFNYLNMLFLLTSSFVPFSAHLLGQYPENNFAITFYSCNIIIIGLSLYVLRQYILDRSNLLQENIRSKDVIHGTIRIFLPPVFAALAIIFAYLDKGLTYILLIFPFVFNILPGGLNYLEYFLFHRKELQKNPNYEDKNHVSNK